MRSKTGNNFVLPSETIDLIHQWSEGNSQHQFAIGDLTAELIDEFFPQYPKLSIRQAVAIEYGAAVETIRGREQVARKIDWDLRDSFPVLGFYQWKEISQARDRAAWEQLARWAVESADEYNGRPAPVSAIRRKIANLPQDGLPLPWMAMWDRVLELADAIAGDEEADLVVRKLCSGLVADASG